MIPGWHVKGSVHHWEFVTNKNQLYHSLTCKRCYIIIMQIKYREICKFKYKIEKIEIGWKSDGTEFRAESN